MSWMSDIMQEMDERFWDWTDEKKALYAEVRMSLDYNRQELDTETADFFQKIMPEHEGEFYWMMVSDNRDSTNVCCKSIEELQNAAAALIREKYNLYYSPASYRDWRVDKAVCHVQTLFIDIDDVEGEVFYIMDTEEIKNWLMETYSLPEDMLPCWVVSSGHGLHLYYRIEELDMNNEEERQLRSIYTDYLIRFFRADKACRNLSRILRVPGSHNVKHEEVLTELHPITPERVFDLWEMDFFEATEEEIAEYMRQNQEQKNAKSRETRARHKAEKEAAARAAGKSEPETGKAAANKGRKKQPKKEADREAAQPKEEKPIREKGMVSYRTDFKPHNRYWNIIKDLNNYYCRHNGQIEGHRNQFFHLMGVYLQHAMSLSEAIEFILPYTDGEFEEEAIRTVRAVYESDVQYRYRNITIAGLLNFTQQDIDDSYCCFSKERMEAARKARERKAHQKEAEARKEARGVAKRRNEMEARVRNSSLPNRELARELQVSERTIRRIRKKIQGEAV